MDFPIVVADRGGKDLSLYASVAAAESQLEAVDVRNNEYVAYDAAGRLLTISMKAEIVRITAGDTEPRHEQELRSALVSFLVACGTPKETLDGLALNQLIALVDRSDGFAPR